MKRNLFAMGAAIALLLPLTAIADSGPYVSGSVGRSDLSNDFDGFNVDSSSTAWRLAAGWRFNDYFALEGGYRNFGRFEQDFTIDNEPVAISLKADGFTLGGVANLPVGERFGLFARAGAYFWDGDGDINGVSAAQPEDTNLYAGLGLSFALGERWALTADGSRYELDDTSSTVFSLGVEVRF